MSTSDALILAVGNIRRKIDESEIVAAACLDLSKSFDSISYDILLQKVEKPISKQFSLNDPKFCRIQKACLETVCSDWIKLYQGVPPGTTSGPLLFNIYVNSMRVTEPVKIVHYADNTFLFTATEDIKIKINHLQRVIENLLVIFQLH